MRPRECYTNAINTKQIKNNFSHRIKTNSEYVPNPSPAAEVEAAADPGRSVVGANGERENAQSEKNQED